MNRIPHRFSVVAIVFCVSFGRAAAAQESPSVEIEADVVYGHKDGLALTMDVFRPETKSNGAAILFMVSGGWYSHWAPPTATQSLFQPYLDKGYTMMAVRHGSSPRYGIPEIVSDVRRAVRFVRSQAQRFGIDANRLGVWGMSAGGHLALTLGTTGTDGSPNAEDRLEQVSSRVAAVVAYVPPTDLRVMVWDAPETLPAYKNFPALDLSLEEAKRYSPLVHVTADDAPALVFMGGQDDLVPAKHGRWIDKAFQKQEVDHKLIVFPDAGHGLEGADNRATLTKETIAWFDRYLTIDSSYARPELLVEPTELAQRKAADNWVILDARPQDAYESAHIPGARRVDHDVWKEAFRDRRDARAWSQRIAALGIDSDSRVVVYDDNGMKDAARIWWILRFWGIEHASLLNGGWKTWQSAQLPETDAAPKPAATTEFTAAGHQERLATTAQMLDWLPNQQIQIVDARSSDEFCGIDKRDNQRGGAIPGAKHLEWSDLIDQDTDRFKSASELRQLFHQAGIDITRPTATHCNGGGRASVMAFGLELLGDKRVRNYYLGWGAWGNREDTPVIVPTDADRED